MEAICLEQPRRLTHISIDDPPEPGPGEVLVRTHRMGVCGTDVSCYLGKFPFFRYPGIPGHELGVEVLSVGAGVTNVDVGDRCSVEPYMNCGHCSPCRRGRGNCCTSLKVIGVMVDGGLCERFLIRADKLHPSQKLSYEQLALVETLAIGCHATDRGAPAENDNVLIIGAGPIGLATLEFTRLTGARITVMDTSRARLDFCCRVYGIENLICPSECSDVIDVMKQLTDGDLYAVVNDATGNCESMSSAVRYVAACGTIVYVGITTEEVHFPHPAIHRPEATIRSSRNALPGDFGRILRLIESGQINTDPWITHRIPWKKICSEFESLTRPETGVVKAMIEVGDLR